MGLAEESNLDRFCQEEDECEGTVWLKIPHLQSIIPSLPILAAQDPFNNSKSSQTDRNERDTLTSGWHNSIFVTH